MHISLVTPNSVVMLFSMDKLVSVQNDLCKKIIFGTYFIIANVWKLMLPLIVE